MKTHREDYLSEVLKTENLDLDGIISRFSDPKTARIAHSILGIADEAGELAKNLKKHIFYGSDLDKLNILEEFGDILWFMGPALDTIGSSYEEVQKMNIRKLRARYPEGKWNKEDSENRDPGLETEAMTKQGSFNF